MQAAIVTHKTHVPLRKRSRRITNPLQRERVREREHAAQGLPTRQPAGLSSAREASQRALVPAGRCKACGQGVVCTTGRCM
eukprot:6198902-Pleurochrysis_carterae.AAC.1